MAAPTTNPGVPIYRRRSAPEHLRTYARLKAEGLRPAHVARPDGVYRWRERADGIIEWMWLYDIRQARPYVCTTKHASAGKLPRVNLRQGRTQ